MGSLKFVAQIPEPRVFLCGEVFRCEVVVKLIDTDTVWKVKSIEGILVGQCRLDVAAFAGNLRDLQALDDIFGVALDKTVEIDSSFIPGLDSRSHIFSVRRLRSTISEPLVICVERPFAKVTLKIRIPEHLPPSYRGNIIRFAYQALIKVQVDDASPQLLRLPLRILPSVSKYYPIDSFSGNIVSLPKLMSSACTESHSLSERVCNPFHIDFSSGLSNEPSVFSEGISQNDSVPSAIFDKLSQLYASNQVSCTINPMARNKGKKNKRSRTSSLSQSPSALLAEIVSSAPMATFVISGPIGHICRIGIFKTVARLGDSLRGYLDFRSAVVPSFECTIRADTNEFLVPLPKQEINVGNDVCFSTVSVDVPTILKSKVPSLPENTSTTSWFETKLVCSNTKFLPFAVPIPLNAPADFTLASKYWHGVCRVQWCLRFQFTVAKSKPRLASDQLPKLDLFHLFLHETPSIKYGDYVPFINSDTQTFPWELPICVIPNGPAAFALPSQSFSTCAF